MPCGRPAPTVGHTAVLLFEGAGPLLADGLLGPARIPAVVGAVSENLEREHDFLRQFVALADEVAEEHVHGGGFAVIESWHGHHARGSDWPRRPRRMLRKSWGEDAMDVGGCFDVDRPTEQVSRVVEAIQLPVRQSKFGRIGRPTAMR